MNETISIIISAIWISAYIMTLITILSLLLFLTGLWRFIRYEQRLARNWNRLRSYAPTPPDAPRPTVRRPRDSRQVMHEPIAPGRARRPWGRSARQAG